MNKLEKIFRLIINFGDSEKRIPEVGKLLQSLYARLQNILHVIREIGAETGIKEAASAMKLYDTTVKAAEKSKRKYAETTAEENARNQEAQKYIEALKSKYGNLVFTKRDIATLTKNYAVLQRAEKGSIEELDAKINILSLSWKKMGVEKRNSVQGKQVTADLNQMREELRKTTMAAGDNTRNIGNYVSGLYGVLSSKFGLITGVVMGVKRLLWTIFQPFQDLEYRMSMVKAVTQATDEEFIALEADARRLGAATQYTATEVAGLQIVYGQMGFAPEQIIAITEATLDLATATGEDLAKSADIAGATLRAFNLDASQMPRVIDVMTLALNKSALKLDIFGEAMKYVAPIAANTGVSIEECSALIGVLADQGIRGSMAGTSLRRILSELAKDGRPLNERLDELSKNGISVTDAMDEVGKHAMTALTIIGNNTQKVDDLTEAFDNAAGAAKATAAITRDNMRTDGLVFLSAVQEKLIAIGEFLSPLARWIIQTGTAAVANLKNVLGIVATYTIAIKAASIARAAWSVATKQASIYETAFGKSLMVNMAQMKTATASTQLLAVAKLLLTGQVKAAGSAFSMFTKTLMKNPFGLIAVGLASVISYFAFFRKETESTSQAYSECADNINKEKQAIDDLKSALESSEEGSVKRRDLINEINEKYKEYLPQMLSEKSSYEEIKTALESVNKTLEENIRLKYASKIAEEEQKKITDAEDNLIQELKSLWEESNKGRQMSVETELQIVNTARELTRSHQQLIEDVANGVDNAMEKHSRGYTFFMQTMREGLGLTGNQLIIAASEANKSVTAAAERLFQANAVITGEKPQDSTTTTTTTTTTTPDPKDKGEWSLSKDKAYNEALLRLKEQLHTGEIASEEAYNKQTLELEIDTLSKRIGLNRDANEVLLKLRSELADKQYQLQKTEKKEAEAATADEQARAALRLKYENDHIDAGIAALKDGVDKRVRLNDQATKKSLESAEQSYKAEIKSLEEKQKGYNADSAEYRILEAEKAEIFFAYDQKCTDIRAAGADERGNILRDATVEELTEYAKLPGKAAEAERLITENKRIEVEKRLALAKEETEQSIGRAQNQYGTNENLADATIGKSGRKRNVARLQNEIQLHKDQAQAYQKELDAILSGGDNAIEEHKTRYDELIQLIGKEQESAMNLGKGKTAEGKRKSIWTLLTEMSDEDVAQLKQQAFDLALQIGDAMIQAQQQASQRRLNNEKKAIEAQYKIESKLLDDRRDKGLISEKTYQKEMEKLEAEKAKKEEEAERAAFEREKRLNIMQAIMNTAAGIAKAIAQSPITFGLPWAAFAAAQGAIQIATIASQKFAQGGVIPLGDKMGVVKGRSHAQGGNVLSIDGRPIGEIEHDELIAIVNKHDTRRIGALSAANSVHGRKFADGGLVGQSGYRISQVAPPVSLSRLDAQLRVQEAQRQEAVLLRQDAAIQVLADNIQATNARIDRIKVLVVAQEVSDIQDGIKKIQVKSSW